MARIKVMDAETVNLVAAGEVVERPASVVKELVENAFDAGATQVEISVEKELKGVTVADNGWGIAAEDVLLAFERHATSKISSSADLGRIRTLGFRGEALPSIAAVARVQLKTRAPEVLGGTLLVIEGGEVRDFRPVGAPPGTTITVRDLFYNTPVRRKFLGSTRVESVRLTDVVTRLALGRPDVSVRLVTGGREVFHTPGTGLLGAITAIYGRTVAEALVPVEAGAEGVRVEGYTGRPALVRTTRSGQTLLVNGRYVRHTGLTAAVYHAYGTLLPSGKHPFFVLRLILDPSAVDVNVHPQKLAVRFAREKEVTGLVHTAVKKALFGRISLIPGAVTSPKPLGAGALPPGDWVGALRRLGPLEEGHFSTPGAGRIPDKSEHPGGIREGLPVTFQHELFFREEKPPYNEQSVFPALEYLAFMPPVYILASGPGGLFLVDQHAAHERVLFEEYGAAVARGAITSQVLMHPETVDLDAGDLANALELARYGFIIEPFGEGTALLRAIPAGLGPDSARLLLADLLACLSAGEEPVREQAALASMACHSAVKAGEALSPAEAVALLLKLAVCREPFTCPHGRPTTVCLSHEELLRRFGRGTHERR